MDYSNIFGFSQPYSLATAGTGVGVSPMAYSMPNTMSPAPVDANTIASFGQQTSWPGSDGANWGAGAAGTPQQGMFGKAGDWLSNGNNLSTVIQGIGTLGQAWIGFQQLQQAKDALNFQKKAFNVNLANSTKDYNTSLEDRIRGRTADYSGKEADVQKYLAAHSL